jgi:hypothetical protein
MSAKVALQLNALVGLASTAAASAMISLVLTRPVELASRIAQHEYGAVVMAVVHELGAWLHVLLRFI